MNLKTQPVYLFFRLELRSLMESIMKTVSTFLFLSLGAFFQLSCTNNAANENPAQMNVNTAIVAETVQTNTNANVIKAEETPVPTFTNSDEALAEGKKLLDELETEKAIDALSQATKLSPDLAEAHFNLGIAYALAEKDEEEKAITQVEATPKPTGKNKKNAPPRTKNSEKAFENAVKTYKKILAKNPKDDVAQFNLGRAYNKLNEDEDAAKALKEAVKLKPEDGEYQTELGAIQIKLAQYDEAVAALKKAIKLDETNLQAADLLEKAEAGRRRVDFGNKPKPLQTPPPSSGQIKLREPKQAKEGTPDAPKEQPKEPSRPAQPSVNKPK